MQLRTSQTGDIAAAALDSPALWAGSPGSGLDARALTRTRTLHSGATRNVYIGNVEDFDKFNEEKLKRDFGEYGDVELVNFLKEKCVSFSSI